MKKFKLISIFFTFYLYSENNKTHMCNTHLKQYHTLDNQLKNKKAESNYYAEDMIHLQIENKSLAEEIVSDLSRINNKHIITFYTIYLQ